MSIVAGGILAIAGIAQLVLFIIFWVKVAGYSSQLGDLRYLLPGDLEYDDDYRDGRDDQERGYPPSPKRDADVPPDAFRPDDPGQFRR